MKAMKTILLFLVLASTIEAQQPTRVVIAQPRRQSNSLWNPANRNRDWVDYAGRTGRQREAGTVTQWIATPVPVFPGRPLPTGKTVVIVNPYVKQH